MSNLFGLIDEKKCSCCGFVKPKDMFGFFKRKDRGGSIKYDHRCRECKRKYENKRALLPERKEKSIIHHKTYRQKKRELKRAEAETNGILSKDVGVFSKVAWCKCSNCNSVTYYKHKQLYCVPGALNAGMCNKCYRSSVLTGIVATKRKVKCVDCGCDIMGTASKRRCSVCHSKRQMSLKKAQRSIGERSDRSIVDRAKKHGVHIDRVNRVIVYNRDGWMCYLCGVRVVSSKTYRPDQATLDHIIPLSAGGPHTYDNVMTCCHRCNTNKSNKVGVASMSND